MAEDENITVVDRPFDPGTTRKKRLRAPQDTVEAARRLAAKAADVLKVEVVSKYGTPPDVPVTVNPSVPEVVTGDPLVPKILDAGTEYPTDVTVPEPADAQVPSPLQYVLDEAPVPLFKLFTERLPDTSLARSTAPKVGAPEAFPCRRVVVVPADTMLAGAPPAPPPRISLFEVSAADEASDVALLK